jgi:hypothetical protein
MSERYPISGVHPKSRKDKSINTKFFRGVNRSGAKKLLEEGVTKKELQTIACQEIERAEEEVNGDVPSDVRSALNTIKEEARRQDELDYDGLLDCLDRIMDKF